MLEDLTRAKNILVVDDSAEILQLLKILLEKNKYNVTTAKSGEECLNKLDVAEYDLILLDVIMPDKDGLSTCIEIKKNQTTRNIPIIFITGKSEGKDIARGFEVGAVDYISKPIYPKEVISRVEVHLKLQDLIDVQKQLVKKIEKQNKLLIEEQHIAKDIFDKFVHAGCIGIPLIKYWISSMSIFNGDVILVNRHVNGNLYICMGDFTGHGLPASIGIIPLADSFYTMSNKGFVLSEIVSEINKKLNLNLPVGIFCAATLISINFQSLEAQIWNGSLPGVDLVKQNGEVKFIKSKNLPLGIIPEDSFNPVIEHIKLEKNDRFYLYTDGIVEARDKNGKFFGIEKIRACYEKYPAKNRFESILQEVEDFNKNTEQDDDFTLMEIKIQPCDITKLTANPDKSYNHRG